ncbi:hypothetical protein Q9966_011140 [Columba livia]|nr:hypothetical protein Q9966_011140 [Columba livia]
MQPPFPSGAFADITCGDSRDGLHFKTVVLVKRCKALPLTCAQPWDLGILALLVSIRSAPRAPCALLFITARRKKKMIQL